MNGSAGGILGSSRGPKHHFFGFHDLIAWNRDETRIVCLEVDRIDHLPLGGQRASVGHLDTETYDFVPISSTTGFNYPQGARQQWWGETNNIIFNDQVGGDWGSCIFDTDTGKCVQKLTSTAHVVSARSGDIFGINYSRLFRLGAYGYNGLKDRTADEKVPKNDGIFKNNIAADKPELLISIADVASVEGAAGAESFDHYLTHLVLSPDERRIVFLHRYRTGEGETTRMMTVGVDGSGMRCLATGFLSHFDWQDNDHIVIWGRTGSVMEKMRGSKLYSHVPPGVLWLAKKVVKKLFMGKEGVVSGFKWHVFHDSDSPVHSTMADGVIMEDGHPMFCPANRDWMICDHYPHADGIRTLFLYQVSQNKRIDLGTYKMLDAHPDPALTQEALSSISPKQIRLIGRDLLAFRGSGLHCDLHPRWDRSGTKVAFDSIHEGTRQLYVQDVSSFVQRTASAPGAVK